MSNSSQFPKLEYSKSDRKINKSEQKLGRKFCKVDTEKNSEE